MRPASPLLTSLGACSTRERVNVVNRGRTDKGDTDVEFISLFYNLGV